MAITPLPTPPSRQDSANFASRGDAFMAALPAFVVEANILQADVAENASIAQSAVDAALANANYVGQWSGLSGALNIPASVRHAGFVWMLLNNVTNVAAETPGVSAAWMKIESAGNLGSAAYSNVGDFQPAIGSASGILKANGSGVVSSATASDIVSAIGATPVAAAITASSATVSGSCTGNAATSTTAATVVDGGISASSKLADRVVSFAKMVALTTGKLIGRSSSGAGDAEEISIGNNLTLSAGQLSVTRSLTFATAVASTSGVSVDFTGIPAWAKRIMVMLSGVSTNGSSQLLLQLGDSGGVENTGYTGTTGYNTSYINHSAGFNLDTSSSPSAATVRTGAVVISLLDGNQWVAHGVLGLENTAGSFYVGGRKTLSATLDRIRITTVGGSDTFDAGSINICWE